MNDLPIIAPPSEGEYAPYYKQYIELVGSNDLLAYFTNAAEPLRNAVSGLSEEQLLYRYAPGKWSVKELLTHIIDTERIFSYRVLCFARGEKTPLPGFEENDYAKHSAADSRTIENIVGEYSAVRTATIELFKSFDADALTRSGNANGNTMSVRAIGYIIAGHELHHLNVMNDRYLGKA